MWLCCRVACLACASLLAAVSAAPPDRANRVDNEAHQLAAPDNVAVRRPEVAAPPSHLEAVPLERDGALNKQFRAELVLGSDTHGTHVSSGPMGHDETADTETLVRQLFHKADVNKDGKVSKAELENVIIANINHHLDESMHDAKRAFQLLDQNADGTITWDEYHYHFLVANELMDEQNAKHHDENDHEKFMHTKYSEKIALDKDNWERADADKSGGLAEKEFLSFRHPEHNAAMLSDMVSVIVSSLDTDADGRLTENEFAAPAGGSVDDKWAEAEHKYIEQRRSEFRHNIDSDKDGKATHAEMSAYMNARNPSHARQEADEIMTLADDNDDGWLTLQELLDKKEYMHDTAVFHPERRMHDEM